MPRILSIDFGTKRTGIAVTDPLKLIATALDTIPTHECVDFIFKYCSREDVEAFVIGEARQMDGTESESLKHARIFAKKLAEKLPATPIFWEDERLTSKIAKQTLFDSGLKKNKRKDKKLLDSTSAVLILQSYLEKNP
jgi:putative Holliday junction resolvase